MDKSLFFVNYRNSLQPATSLIWDLFISFSNNVKYNTKKRQHHYAITPSTSSTALDSSSAIYFAKRFPFYAFYSLGAISALTKAKPLKLALESESGSSVRKLYLLFHFCFLKEACICADATLPKYFVPAFSCIHYHLTFIVRYYHILSHVFIAYFRTEVNPMLQLKYTRLS